MPRPSHLLPLAALASVLLLSACPKNVPQTTGSDDERLDQYSAQLEEMRARAASEELSCDEKCSTAQRACTISGDVCDIAQRNPDRSDLPARCAQSQEDCARFNDSCSACR